ncbi:hypothetical protein GCM10023319_53510 [Nocardia iowensis]
MESSENLPRESATSAPVLFIGGRSTPRSSRSLYVLSQITACHEPGSTRTRVVSALADILDNADHQQPGAVAAALIDLRHRGNLDQPYSQGPATPIRTTPDAEGRDQPIPLARSYTRQTKEATRW